MRVSTRGRYGLRTMYYLAKYSKEKAVPLSIISKELNISDVYLEQLVRKLRQAELVESIRGAHGGYKLKRSPEDIKVGDILRVLETHMSPTECCDKNVCIKEDDCVTRHIWMKIQNGVNEIIDGITLKDMLDKRFD